jgi:hypothetical protein
MSVDERLRAGLELNASTVAPEGEARLVAVRRRHRRRMSGLALGGVGTVAAGVALAVGLASGGADRAVPPEPAPPVVTPPPAPETAGLIPDSTWRRVVTATEASAGGVSEGRIRDDIGTDGRLPMEMRLTTDTFTQTGDFGGSGWQVGDSGTVAYDDRGRLVVTSLQCAACSPLTVTWRLEGGRLVLIRATGSNGPMEQVIWTGTWRRTD